MKSHVNTKQTKKKPEIKMHSYKQKTNNNHFPFHINNKINKKEVKEPNKRPKEIEGKKSYHNFFGHLWISPNSDVSLEKVKNCM